MERLIEACMRSRLWISMAVLFVAGAGVYSLLQLPIDAMPDITNIQVMVNTATGPLAPEEIESDITYPVEAELAGLPGVEEIRSISKYGLSQVIVIFEDGVNAYFARQLVSERLQALKDRLPPGVTPEFGPLATGLGEVMQYAVVATPGGRFARMPEEQRLMELRTIQEYTIKPELKTVPGVEEVDTIGGYDRAVHIDIDPVRMNRAGLGLGHLAQLLDGLGQNTGGGYIETNGQRFILRSHGRIESIEQIRRFPVRVYALGAPIQLDQIANVHEAGEPRVGAATYRGQETVVATVMVRIGENSRSVAQAALERLKVIDLPDGIEVVPLYSQSYLVNSTIHTVEENLLLGATLVVVVLLLLLRNFRAALIVSLAIPLSMLFAVSGMLASGVSANLMSLGAVDFGLVVDGSVVMIENIVRRLDERSGAKLAAGERFQVVLQAAREVAPPVISGLLIIMVVYIPILSFTGIEGKLFAPMAKTVLLAISASLVVAIAVMPMLAFTFLRPRAVEHESRLQALYRPVLRFSLTHRPALIVGAVLVAIAALFINTRLGSDFIPEMDEGDIVLSLTRPGDISLPEVIRIQLATEALIAQFGEVEDVYCKLGAAESNVDPNGLNLSDTFIILKKDRSQWPLQENGQRRTKDELIEAICEAIEDTAQSEECSPEEPIGGRFNDILEGSRADVALRIFGPDLDQLLELTNQAREILEPIDGVDEVQENHLTTLRRSTVLDFNLRPDRLNAFDLHPGEVNQVFETAMAGSTVGYYYVDGIRFPIVLRLADAYRNDLNGIGQVPIDRPGGQVLSLGEVGALVRSEQVTTIARNNSRRYSTVGVFLKDRDLQSFVEEAQQKVAEGLTLPPGFHLEWGGQFKNLVKARLRLAIVVPVTLLLIFLVLLRSFGSFRQTLLIFLCIPFAVTGGVFALYLRDISFSIPASIGFIALAGIAILNGTVLVNFFNQLRQQGKSVREAVEQGALTRLRPVLMTALVASIGFLPMALNRGTGAEVQRPLATVVIGGLVTATMLTLLLLPALYDWMEKRNEKRKSN
ncbi:MAG: efflux RND transporter permease subunit [Spirochaetales bacterium]|nr:efflux RND transporter permease subunit [Leptospiraceae bacterium]MCP5480986.1 efflux RND transporter permease subunit [Spirochaetales bacterium]MCP5485366.1 efflux RND transporter permease subunit [Spirochaetales bacterium]